MKPTREEIIAAADWLLDQAPDWKGRMEYAADPDQLEAFYLAAYKAGMMRASDLIEGCIDDCGMDQKYVGWIKAEAGNL